MKERSTNPEFYTLWKHPLGMKANEDLFRWRKTESICHLEICSKRSMNVVSSGWRAMIWKGNMEPQSWVRATGKVKILVLLHTHTYTHSYTHPNYSHAPINSGVFLEMISVFLVFEVFCVHGNNWGCYVAHVFWVLTLLYMKYELSKAMSPNK